MKKINVVLNERQLVIIEGSLKWFVKTGKMLKQKDLDFNEIEKLIYDIKYIKELNK